MALKHTHHRFGRRLAEWTDCNYLQYHHVLLKTTPASVVNVCNRKTPRQIMSVMHPPSTFGFDVTCKVVFLQQAWKHLRIHTRVRRGHGSTTRLGNNDVCFSDLCDNATRPSHDFVGLRKPPRQTRWHFLVDELPLQAGGQQGRVALRIPRALHPTSLHRLAFRASSQLRRTRRDVRPPRLGEKTPSILCSTCSFSPHRSGIPSTCSVHFRHRSFRWRWTCSRASRKARCSMASESDPKRWPTRSTRTATVRKGTHPNT